MLKTIRVILHPLGRQKYWLLRKAEAIPDEFRPTYEKGKYPEGCARIVNNALQKIWQVCRSTKQIPIDKQISSVIKKNSVLFLKIQTELIRFRAKPVDKLDNLLLNHYNSAVVWLKGVKWVADVAVEVEDQYVVGRPEAVVGIDLGKWHNCYSVWIDGKEAYRAFDQFGNYHFTMQKITRKIAETQQKFEGTRRQLSQVLKPLYEKRKMVLRQYYGTLRNKILSHIPEGYNAVFVVEDLESLPRAEMRKTQRTWAMQELADGIFASQIEWNGYKLVKVNARGTTHTCSRCGAIWKGEPKDRKMRCGNCGLILDRDLNGARNIGRRYMLSLIGEHTCTPKTDSPFKAICKEETIEKTIEEKSESNEPSTLVAERLQ